MFDIGWSEILIIAVVAIVVVGPKDLPRMLRAFGKTLGQVRRTANDFKRQFDDALREAEREADLADTRKTLQSITTMNPLADIKKDLDQTMRQATSAGGGPSQVAGSTGTADAASTPAIVAAGAPEPGSPSATGPVRPSGAVQAGSDAA